jgi:hypothetical protein
MQKTKMMLRVTGAALLLASLVTFMLELTDVPLVLFSVALFCFALIPLLQLSNYFHNRNLDHRRSVD